MATEHTGRPAKLLGAVAALTFAVAGCSGGSGRFTLGPSVLGGVGVSRTVSPGQSPQQTATSSPAMPALASASVTANSGNGGGTGSDSGSTGSAGPGSTESTGSGSGSTGSAGPGSGSGSGAGAGSGGSGGSTSSGGSTGSGGRAPSTPATGGYASSALPARLWTTPAAIPLYAAYHWQSPAALDKKASAPTLVAVRDCRLALSSGDRSELATFPAAQAELTPTTGDTGGRDDWSAQETVLAAGDTSSGDIQGIYTLYTRLVAAVGTCATAAPGAKLSNISKSSAGFAATLSIPTSTGTTLTVHEYLAAPYGYLVELAVWVAPYAGDKPGASWGTVSSRAVLAALSAGPCAVSKAC